MEATPYTQLTPDFAAETPQVVADSVDPTPRRVVTGDEWVAALREEREGADYDCRRNPNSDYGPDRNRGSAVAHVADVTVEPVSVDPVTPETYDKSRSPAASRVQYDADQAYWAGLERRR